MKTKLTLRTLALPALLLSTLNPQLSTAHAQGTAFTYQGVLTENGAAANGVYDFEFTLKDAATLGNNVGLPLTANDVGVSNGLFMVTLDFGANFPGADRWLQLGVRTNSGGAFVTLAPHQQLTPAPYAITASNLSGTLPATQLSGALSSAQLADTIALGATNVIGRLDVYRTAANTPAITLDGSSSVISTFGSDGLEQIRLHGTSYGELLLRNSLANNATAVNLTAQGSTGGRLTLNNTNGSSRAILEGENTGGLLTLYTADGNLGAILYGNDGAGSGTLSLRNTNGSSRLRAFGGPTSGSLELYDDSGTRTFLAQGAESATSGSQLLLHESDGSLGIQLDGEKDTGGGGFIVVYKGDGTAAIVLDAESDGKGRITSEDLQVTSSTTTLTNGATLNPTTGYMRISGSGGAVTLNATTAIANGVGAGLILVLEGTSTANTVTIPTSANTLLGANRTLGLNDTLTLIWNGANWVQLAFSNN
jgi:hypothetical protein